MKEQQNQPAKELPEKVLEKVVGGVRTGTPVRICCPKCNADQFYLLPQSKLWVCTNCGHQVSMNASMRVQST